MSRFSVEIPSNTADHDQIRLEAIEEAQRFAYQKLGREPLHPFTWQRPRMDSLLDDLRKGRLSPLFLVNGNYVPRLQDMDDIHPESTSWGRNHFNQKELQAILEICSKLALTLPTNPDYSKEQKGHSVLHGALTMRNSIFAEALTPDVRKRLNNGRFWEELPEVSYGLNNNVSARVVGDVLDNHFADLNPNFAPTGMELFRRNNHHRTHALTTLDQFSERELDNYYTFVARVDQVAPSLELDQAVLDEMVAPYVSEIVTVEEPYQEVYEPKYGLKSKKFFGYRLKDDLVVKYVTSSEHVKNSLAFELRGQLKFGDPEHVFHVLAFLPNSREMFHRTMSKLYPKIEADRFAADLIKQGLPVGDYYKIYPAA